MRSERRDRTLVDVRDQPRFGVELRIVGRIDAVEVRRLERRPLVERAEVGDARPAQNFGGFGRM